MRKKYYITSRNVPVSLILISIRNESSEVP